ncbi:DgyrCDS13458 [Dimorphilus gyrociliatus]|uniref:DgyrCDS13458 n=1 Tax=Dimorphilus gyrociliatus TaxID=2664684 RepID=A0A7I8WAU2_9ANNE|nr:DgyrCDS13458 [Dimorphilus gyrociliatus]
MEMLDSGLDSQESKPNAAELATNSQDLGETTEDSNAGSQLTYRVIQIGSGSDNEGSQSQILGTQVLQSNAFSNGSNNSPSNDDASNTTRFAYVSGSNTESQTVEAASLTQVQTPQGHYFVMMNPQDVIPASRTIAPSRSIQARTISGDTGKTSRDERRRATHNEVERRRRDKINNWIVQLSKLIPDCAMDGLKGTQMSTQSKGGILAKACEYIEELRTSNNRMVESHDLLRQQLEELKSENTLLRQSLNEAGVSVPTQDFSNS